VIAFSVVMPTSDRPAFAEHAARLFRARTGGDSAELIVVDGGKRRIDPSTLGGAIYKRAPAGTPVGALLNIGCRAAGSNVFIKQDDDDFYAPRWYGAAADAARRSVAGLAGVTDFYYYSIGARAAGRWCTWGADPADGSWSGGACAFTRRALELSGGFREDLRGGVDVHFCRAVQSRAGSPRAIVSGGTDLYVHVRHGANLSIKHHVLPAADPESLAAVARIMGAQRYWYDRQA
jgi:hypothetical protein